jgi:hypothetical protein
VQLTPTTPTTPPPPPPLPKKANAWLGFIHRPRNTLDVASFTWSKNRLRKLVGRISEHVCDNQRYHEPLTGSEGRRRSWPSRVKGKTMANESTDRGKGCSAPRNLSACALPLARNYSPVLRTVCTARVMPQDRNPCTDCTPPLIIQAFVLCTDSNTDCSIALICTDSDTDCSFAVLRTSYNTLQTKGREEAGSKTLFRPRPLKQGTPQKPESRDQFNAGTGWRKSRKREHLGGTRLGRG